MSASPPSDKILLQVVGPPRLLCGDGQVSVGAKPLALLAYLAIRGGQPSRRSLAHLLWPTAHSASALHSLSQAIYTIRKACGDGALMRQGDAISLGTVASDIGDFRSAMERNAWSYAASQVIGPLCAGLQIDSLEFNHWLDGARVRFLEDVRVLLPELELRFEWSLLLQLIPLVKEGLGSCPDTERLEALANAALNAGPSTPIQLLSPGGQSVGRQSESLPFIGRRRELQAVSAVQDAVTRAGSSDVLLLCGPSGIGKSALADRIARLSALRGWRVLQAKGYPTESNLPLGVVEQLFADPELVAASAVLPTDLRAAIAGAFPTLATEGLESDQGDPPVRRIRLFQAFRAALLGRANGHPQLLLIDDFNWVDPSSKGLIHHLLGRSFPSGLLLILVSPSADERNIRREFEPSTIVRLGGLSLDETAELLDRVPHDDHRCTAPSLHSRSGGNPLLIRTLLLSATEGSSGGIATSASEYFQRRFDGVGSDARLFFAALAVLGGSATPEVVADVAGTADSTIPQTLLELSNHDLIVAHGDSVDVVHGLAGEVILADLSPVVRRLLYARAAKQQRDHGDGTPAVLAVQLDIAGESVQAYQAALEAVAASERLSANREAEYFLKLVLAHAPGCEEAGHARLRLADLYLRTGHSDKVGGILSWAEWFRCSPEKQLWKRVYEITVALARQNQLDTAIDEAWSLVDEAIAQDWPEAAAHLLMKIAPASSDIGRLQDVRKSAHTLIDLLPRLPKAYAMRCRGAAAAAIALADSVAIAKELVEDLFVSADTPQDRIHYFGATALIHYTAGELRQAEEDNLAALSLSERHGIYTLYVQLLNNLSVCYVEMGRYEHAKDCLERALDFTSGHGPALVAYDNLGLIAFEEGNYRHCIELLDRGAEINRAVQSRRSSAASLGLRGLANLELGRLADAFECERELKQIDSQRNFYLSDVSYVELFAARMHVVRLEYQLAADRLKRAIAEYRDRDPFARSRLQIELLRVEGTHLGADIRHPAKSLVTKLETTGATPLVKRLNELIQDIS